MDGNSFSFCYDNKATRARFLGCASLTIRS